MMMIMMMMMMGVVVLREGNEVTARRGLLVVDCARYLAIIFISEEAR